MNLDRVVDPLAARLSAALSGVRVSDVEPIALTDLPCAILSLEEAAQALVGIGRVSRGTRTGALRLSASIDLSNPVLDLGNGETLQLLSADRRTLALPHGPIVGADGTTDPPLGPDDVSADDGAPFTVVAPPPTGRQVRADPVQGTLDFGLPLAAAGRLDLTYYVGQWDTVTTRVQALLSVRIVAVTAPAVSATARDVASSLAAPDPGVRAVPSSWAPVLPVQVGDDDARSQLLAFRLDAELEDPVLTTGGGVIAQVVVTGGLGDPTRPGAEPIEPFDVTKGAPT